MDFDAYFDRVYENYDRYFLIPLVILVLAGGALGYNYITQGEFLEKGTDFTGGTEVQANLQQDFTTAEIEAVFAGEGWDTNAIRQTTAEETTLVIRAPPTDGETLGEEETKEILADAGYSPEIISFRTISAAVSGQFFQQAVLALVMAFTIMSLVIFVAFRDITPSVAVIFAAAGDILVAASGMVILGIPLTLGSLAALLMLIGYSVDTDIVLSTRVLKKNRGSLKSRIWSSAKTGITMSSGGIAGFTLLYIASYIIVGPSELTNIAGVMVIGLLADMPLTWFGNAIILKKYVNGEINYGVLPWN